MILKRRSRWRRLFFIKLRNQWLLVCVLAKKRTRKINFCNDFVYLEIIIALKILKNEIKITSRSPFRMGIQTKSSSNLTDQLIFNMISAEKNSLGMLLKLSFFRCLQNAWDEQELVSLQNLLGSSKKNAKRACNKSFETLYGLAIFDT